MMTRQIGEFERWASGIASTVVGAWGMRRGGIVGLLALAGAGFIAWRTGTGRSLMPQGGRKVLEKAIPALTKDEEAPHTPPTRRAPAKAKLAPTTRRRAPAKAAATGEAAPSSSPAAPVKGAPTKGAQTKGATAKTRARIAAAKTEAPTSPKARPQRRKAAGTIASANGSTSTPKSIN